MAAERRNMDARIKLNVKALAAYMNLTIRELAEKADISPEHLASVSSGRATMTARDLMHLAAAADVSPYNIEYN